jgi:starch phosphorylase
LRAHEIRNNTFPNIPDRISRLGELAENLWWCWNPHARMLFKMLDRQAWKDSGHNPDRMLKALPDEALIWASRDQNYLRHYDLVMSHFDAEAYPGDYVGGPIAYFSAEYGLHHSLPFYAGGLGFLAGDHLKECSDMGVPVVAVGFMYPSGFMQQTVDNSGWQQTQTQTVDRESASISQVYDENGEQIVIEVPHIRPRLKAALWKVLVGRVTLFLMDTEIEDNSPWIRDIAKQLYTSDREQRLLQEIILGIGGHAVLREMEVAPSLLHLNEGHPAFALLEALRCQMEQGVSFEQAKQRLRDSSLLTTHTPVPAGHDVFPADMVEKYFAPYREALGLDRETFLDLGRHPEHPDEGFNMTVLGLKLSGRCNAVSKRHGEVTREMWKPLWPEREQEELPVGHITNGVHLPTWLEPKIRMLFNRYFGDGWIREQDNPAIWEFVEEIPDQKLWRTHYWLKVKLLNFIRQHARQEWILRRSTELLPAMGTMLDPSVLTIGFARRFATYKRADLVFHDLDRLKRLVNDSWRPIQIVFAGKAHPADDEGKRLLQRVVHMAKDPELSGRIAFVENYGEQLAQYLVHGVDVWLNTPKPPMEASGTSGMKAAINGVPSLSIADGWWLEGSTPTNGWTIDSGPEDEGDRDERDAAELYRLIEEDIIPAYYTTSETGVPHDWVRIMKQSIKTVAPHFSARRMIKDYLDFAYGTYSQGGK